MAKPITADEVDAFMRRFKLLIVGIVALFGVPLLTYAVYLNRRLDVFENSLRYRPPPETEGEAFSGDSDRIHLAANPVEGQKVYVPVYSHVYHGDGDPYLLTITLSVRNTSTDDAIVLNSVRYFDTHGKEIKSYLKKPLRLAALATTEFLVSRDDTTGGSGANFLVEWIAERPVSEPIIEAIMIDTKGQQGISFARRGSVIGEAVRKSATDASREGDSTIPRHDATP